ncbi:MAG: pyrroline-5-carboxylate reductase [Ruminococcus sp.]|nr:pyrroline-5-carboxylate reductase [Oscillospiraceae bacterium]MDY4413850.1 pyrroline-5-carboxylate reductase [Ruminococcus sp.]
MQEKINIGFIGAGNMGSAIMKGIAKSSMENIQLFAFDKLSSKTDELKKYGVEICSCENEIVEKCKYVFLAVKPQGIEEVLNTISGKISADTIIVSIVAGISDEYIVSKTIPNAKVILVMPNTPLLLGEGASALSRNDSVSDDEFKLICDIFAVCGKIAVIPKNKMKEIIAVNSSSPAFIYLFAKGFIEYGEKAGIDSDAVKNMFAQALIGSAKMITDSGYTIDELIKMVSSPGGTTLAGLDALYEGKLTDTVNDACERCTKRAYELSK